MSEFSRVNWVRCPNCNWRYYLGEPLLRRSDIPAICPKCRTEFDPRIALEPSVSGTGSGDPVH